MKCFDKTITLSCLLHNIRLFRGLNEKSTRLRAGSAFLFPVARSLDSRFDDLVGRGRGVASYYMANVGGGWVGTKCGGLFHILITLSSSLIPTEGMSYTPSGKMADTAPPMSSITELS